jgi:hypothetical protein
MKTILCLFSLPLLVIANVQAANFTTTTSQGAGQNWNATIWQGTAPAAGNTYQCIFNGTAFGNATANTRVRNPATAGVQTFVGDSLTLDANTEIRAKNTSAILNFPGVGGNPGLILNGGVLNAGDTTVFEFRGTIRVAADSLIAPGDNGAGAIVNGRGIKFNGAVSGNGALIVIQAPINVASMEVISANNLYSGNWIVKAGYLKGSAAGSLGSGNIIVDPSYAVSSTLINPATALAAGPAQFEVTYDINTAGALTLANGGVMLLHQACTFSAVTVQGTILSAGLHTYAELNANFPANFPAGGSGSITVQPPSPPDAPSNVAALSGDTQVTLSWAVAPRASGYNIKRSDTSGGPYTQVGTVAGTSFVNTGLNNGSTYYYVITATNSIGESPNSAQVVGRPNVPVTGVTATGGTGQVAVAWNALQGALSYTVKRAISTGGPYTNVATGVTGTSYLDTSLPGGRTFFYVVFADLGGGQESTLSNEAAGTTAPTPPSLSATLFAATVIRASWTTTDSVVSQYLLESSTDGANFAPLATLAGNQRSYTNSGLALNTTYFYRVQATNAGGLSGYSNIASNTTPTFGVNVNFANATNGQPANNPAPTPPGYFQDVGNLFGDRGNGYSYGWDRDITPDGRWRQAANSPDLRYDTFMHLIKATPPAVWNIAIPNGFYQVHIVAGDPANTDSVFQFNVEGVLTPTVVPGGAGSFNNNWADFTLTTAVSDG